MGSHSPKRRILSSPNMLSILQPEMLWVTGTRLKDFVKESWTAISKQELADKACRKRPKCGRNGCAAPSWSACEMTYLSWVEMAPMCQYEHLMLWRMLQRTFGENFRDQNLMTSELPYLEIRPIFRGRVLHHSKPITFTEIWGMKIYIYCSRKWLQIRIGLQNRKQDATQSAIKSSFLQWISNPGAIH